MAKHPPVYQGNEPYIFISYAHRDSNKVIPIIERLQSWGFRVWYDAGIEAGTEWPEYIASHLRDSHAVIAFISEAAIESPHCRQEITYAGAKRKDVLGIYLDNAVLPAGLELQLGNNQSMFYNRAQNFDSFIESLIVAELLRPCCVRPSALPIPSQRVYAPPAAKSKPAPRPAPARRSGSPAPLLIGIGLVVVALVIAFIVFGSGSGIGNGGTGGNAFASPEEKYQQAMTHIDEGKYYEAYVLLQELGEYEDSQVQLARIQEKAWVQKISTSKKGETVFWGHYEQNNDGSDGKEPIEWVILHAEDGRTLLLSKYGLDCQPYHSELKDINWEKSDLRTWLNDEFYYDAFTSAEQAYLFESVIVTEGSENTRDKVFLLNEEEADLYMSLIPDNVATDYAIHQGAKAKDTNCWLRSPWNAYGTLNMDYAHVYTTSSGMSDSKVSMYLVNTDNIAVRPCIWIETRSEDALEHAYNNAVSLFNAGQFKRALPAFEDLGNYKDSIDYCQRLPELILMQPFMEATIGETVTFGDYDFIVLAKQDDRVLIVSKYGLMKDDYHGYSLATVAWEECTLRQWLNSDFLNRQLGVNDGEKALILSTTVVTEDNPEFGTTGGAETTDRVFILSYEEILRYFPDPADRILYAQNSTSTVVPWWVRTKGQTASYAVYVDTYGTVNLAGQHIFQLTPQEYVRPAMWIKIDQPQNKDE